MTSIPITKTPRTPSNPRWWLITAKRKKAANEPKANKNWTPGVGNFLKNQKKKNAARVVAIPATKTPTTSVRDSGMRRKATKVRAADIQPAANVISPIFLKKLIHVVIKYPLYKSRYLPSPHPDSEKFRESSSQSHCSPRFLRETQRFIGTKNPTPQHHWDIGRTLRELRLSGFSGRCVW